MPKFLENKLKKQYPSDPAAPYKIMNSIGAMKGNQETPKGVQMEKIHARGLGGKKPPKVKKPAMSNPAAKFSNVLKGFK